MNNSLLSVESINVFYDKMHILHDVSLEVGREGGSLWPFWGATAWAKPLQFSDRLYLMEKGSIVFQSETRDLSVGEVLPYLEVSAGG